MFVLLIRISAVLSSLLSAFSFAATEYLPPAITPEEVQAQISRIQAILPWSTANNASYIALQRDGLQALRNQFANFDQWAAAKPDPITIQVESRTLVNQMTLVLNDERFVEIKKLVFTNLNRLLTSNEKENIETLKAKTVQAIGNGLLSGADSVRGLLTGVFQVLPAEQKAKLFKAGEPAVQLQLLRELNLSDEVLRSGVFQAERFGLNSKTITAEELFSVIEGKINSNQNILTQLGIWSVLKRATEEDLKAIAEKDLKGRENLLRASDFNFLDSTDQKFIRDLAANLALAFPNQGPKLEKSLAQTLSSIPKQWFEKKMAPVEVLRPFVKIVEVHPYLGVYRGCAGGDCSTSRSPMYPFSPWEHDYYIITPDGSFVGYVSATIIEAGGKKSLYIKDVTGARLSPDLGELILHAFNEVYSYYGAKQLSIAAAAFTDRENHFQPLKDRYAYYNGRLAPKAGGPVVMEPTEFPDASIRAFIQKTPLFVSDANYDLATNHPTAAIFSPQVDMKNYRVSYKVETLTPFKPKSPRESVIFALRMVNTDENADISQVPGVDEAEVRSLLRILKNERRLSLTQFYAEAAAAFAVYGIETSRSFRQEYENFFLEGHLQASDAYFTLDAALRADSEKYFVTFVRRQKDIVSLALVSRQAALAIGQTERVKALIELLVNRSENEDIRKLITLASVGFEVAQQAVKTPAMQPKVEREIFGYLFGDTPKGDFLRGAYSALPHMHYYVVNSANTSYQNWTTYINRQLAWLGLRLDTIKDKELKMAFNRTLWKMPGALAADSVMKSLYESFKKGEIDLYEFHQYVARDWHRSRQPASMMSVLAERSRELVDESEKTPQDALEAFLIRKYVGQKNGRVHPGLSRFMLQFYKEWRQREQGTEMYTSVYKDSALTEFFAKTRNNYLLALATDLASQFTALDHFMRAKTFANDRYALAGPLEVLGISEADFFSLPENSRKAKRMAIQTKEAFLSPEISRQTFALLLRQIERDNSEYEPALARLISVRRELKGSEQLASFIQKVVDLAAAGKSKAAIVALGNLIQNEMGDNKTKVPNAVLIQLLQIDDAKLRLQLVEKILKAKPDAKISDLVLSSIATLLRNSKEDKVSDHELIYSERAMDVLYQVRTSDEAVQKELRGTYKEEDNMKMVLKAAIAFIKNGGDPSKPRKYVAEAFKEFGSKDKSDEVMVLRKLYKEIAGKAVEESGIRSCGSMFR